MTNTPKDLDQGDVIADAQTMMTKEMESWGEQLDGCDLYTVIMLLESEDYIDSVNPLDDRVVQELIASTQSNPEKATYALKMMIDLDNAIADS